MARIFLLLLFFACSYTSASAEGEGGLYLDPNVQIRLGDSFYAEGDYYRAVTEYKRFLFLFPQSARAEEARWKIAVSYYGGRKWDEALAAAEDLLKRYPDSSFAPEAFLLEGRCYAEKRDYSQARRFFRLVQEIAPDRPVSAEAQWETAVTYVKEERWKEAAEEFRKVSPVSRLFTPAAVAARGLERIDEIPQKSPLTAGVLAVLPGAGHLYTERYRDAAIALALNGAFLWGIVEAFDHKNYVVGGILTFFEVGWYSGNIYSAVSSAHKYNRNKKKEYLEYLEREGNFSLGFSSVGKTPVLSLRYVF